MSYGEYIKTVRKELKISQEQLARLLNVSFSTVNRWENGKSVPSQMAQELLRQLCESRGLKATTISKGDA